MQENNLLIYKNKDGNIVVDAIYKDETLWLTQKGMAKVFDVGIPAISKHLKNIFDEEELNESMVVSKMENTTQHGAIKEKTQTNDSLCFYFRFENISETITYMNQRNAFDIVPSSLEKLKKFEKEIKLENKKT